MLRPEHLELMLTMLGEQKVCVNRRANVGTSLCKDVMATILPSIHLICEEVIYQKIVIFFITAAKRPLSLYTNCSHHTPSILKVSVPNNVRGQLCNLIADDVGKDLFCFVFLTTTQMLTLS